MRKTILIAVLIICLFAISVSADLPQCAPPSTSGCSASGNTFKYYGVCTVPQFGSVALCGPVKAVNGYALALTEEQGYAYWSSSSQSWNAISDPRACSSQFGGFSIAAYSLIGFDKTTSSSLPFIALYAKWNSGSSKWDYAVVSFKAGSSWSGCNAWQMNYHWEGANGADFIQGTHHSFACIKEGAGYNGNSNDQECFWGGTRPASSCYNGIQCFDAWGIQEGYPVSQSKDPGYNDRKNKVYEVQATNKLFAVSGPDNSYYILGVLINSGTATGKIWTPVSMSGSGVSSWTDMIESGRISNSYSGVDSYTDAPRYFVIDKSPSSSYQIAGYGTTAHTPYVWFPSIVTDAIKYSTSINKFQNTQVKLSGGNVWDFGVSSGGVWSIPGSSPSNKINYISNANWGSSSWTGDTCVGSSSDSGGRGFVDYSSNGVGWAVHNIYGGGCLVWSTLTPPTPPPTCSCQPYVATGICGSSCGPLLTCGGTQMCMQRTCSPNSCNATYACQTNSICGSAAVSCRTGGGTPGVWGINWWAKAFMGSENTGACGTDTNPYPTYTANWGDPLTISTSSFHYKNYYADVTISIKEIGSSAGAWTKTIRVYSTNQTTGAPGLFSWSSLLDWQASPFCKQKNYTVSVRVVFPESGSGNVLNYFVTNTFRLNIYAVTTGLPNGANCAACSCGPWNDESCRNNLCTPTPSTPLYQTRICSGGCNPGDGYGDSRCIASSTCNSVSYCDNYTIRDCGSNGCPDDSFSIMTQCYNVVNDPIGNPTYACQSTSECTEEGTCSAYGQGGCGLGGCSPTQMLYTRTCVPRPGDIGGSPYQIQYCLDNANCTVPIPPQTPDYSYQFNFLPSNEVSRYQDVLFQMDFQNNIDNMSYYVNWSYNVCLESDLSYCPLNNSGSFNLYANASNTVVKGVYWGIDPIQGVQQGFIYPGQYRVIFNTAALGSSIAFAQNFSWTVSESNISVILGAISDVNWGDSIYLPVTLIDAISRDLAVSFDFYVNGTKIWTYSPPNTYNSSLLGESHTFGLPATGAPFLPGSYGVRARAFVNYSGISYGGLSNFSNFSIIGNIDQLIDLNVSNTNPRWGQDSVLFTITPRDIVCVPSCKLATELSLGFYEFDQTTNSYGINAYTSPTWSDVPSGTTKTYMINSNGGAQPRWSDLPLQIGKTYMVQAKAKFGVGAAAVASNPFFISILPMVSIDQAGFTPIFVPTDSIGNTPVYVTYGTLSSVGVSPISYICAYDPIYSGVECLSGLDDLGIDVISGVAAVKTADPSYSDGSPVRALIYTGYEILGDGQEDRVGIIDYVKESILGVSFANPRIITVSNPGAQGEQGCISNPVPVNCPLERNVSIGIGIDASNPNSSALFKGGSFAYIYYINNDAWLQCAGSDGLQRMEPLSISSWTTAGTTIPLYYGPCMVGGGITAADIDKDNYTEVMGGGGIVDLDAKTVNYKFGENRAVIPVDVNSDGYLDFVSQENGILDIWPGTAQYIPSYSHELRVSAIQPCQVDSNGRFIASIIASGPGDNSLFEYQMSYGDGVEVYHPSSRDGTANQFDHIYTAKGTYIVTGTVISGSQSASGNCERPVLVSQVPNYYAFSGAVSGICSIGTNGLFTTYSGPISARGWKTEGATFRSSSNVGIMMYSNIPGEIYMPVKSTNSTQILKLRFEPTSNYVFDMSYGAELITGDGMTEIAKVRVFDDRVFIVERGGMNTQIASLVDGKIYDLELILDYQNRSVAVNFGEMGAPVVRVYDDGNMLVSNDFDLLSGEMRFSYGAGAGQVFIFDYACGGGEAIMPRPSQINDYFERIRAGLSASLALLDYCIAGQPDYFIGLANGTNHSVSPDPYPNVNNFCIRLPGRYCDYTTLKYMLTRNPNCYKEIFNYCVVETFPVESGQVGGAVGDGALSCATILGISATYEKAAKPILRDVGSLLTDNWFEVALIIIVILVAAAFAGNRKR